MRKKRKPQRKPGTRAAHTRAKADTYYELEVIPGLAEFAQAELQERLSGKVRLLPSAREDRVRFHYDGDPHALHQLRRSVAVHRVRHFAISRPKALLGHQNLETLMGLINGVLALNAPGSFQTFRISAAGSGSSVFARIKAGIATRTGLQPTEEAGDLLLAVRRPQRLSPALADAESGWEVAVRLAPRPLAARRWRVCDMPGALNGTVASTMVSLTRPSPQDRVVNLACGSGTLLVERLALGPLCGAVGCDLDARVLACAQENLSASGHADAVVLVRCDAGRVPLPDRWATTACADLPFGMLVGSHQTNEQLYPRLLAEAGRLVRGGGTMVAITQEVRLFERVVVAQGDQWAVARVVPLKVPASTRSGYIRPRLYLLQRR
jgi:tRNA (guanine6-N2)-methyltransferase